LFTLASPPCAVFFLLLSSPPALLTPSPSQAAEAEELLLEVAAQKTASALESKHVPIERCAEWREIRAQRPRAECIRDGVEIAINALETECRESCNLLLSVATAQAAEARRLKAVISALKADVKDKRAALAVDAKTAAIKEAPASETPLWEYSSSVGNGYGPFGPQWRGATVSLCSDAEQAVAVSTRVRSKAEEVEAGCMEREASRRAEITRQHAGSLARLREAISHLGRPVSSKGSSRFQGCLPSLLGVCTL